MEKNGLEKYAEGVLERVRNSIEIVNRLLAKRNRLSDLVIEKTATSPYINFNVTSGILRIEGRAIYEDPSTMFFRPTFEWINKYFINYHKNITFKFQLERVNGDSEKVLLILLKETIKKANEKGVKCSVDWCYESDDEFLLELGEHFKKYLKVPFNFYLIK